MITQEEKVDQVRSVTLDCQWGTGERVWMSPVMQVKVLAKWSIAYVYSVFSI